jgi:hypothetical protein
MVMGNNRWPGGYKQSMSIAGPDSRLRRWLRQTISCLKWTAACGFLVCSVFFVADTIFGRGGYLVLGLGNAVGCEVNMFRSEVSCYVMSSDREQGAGIECSLFAPSRPDRTRDSIDQYGGGTRWAPEFAGFGLYSYTLLGEALDLLPMKAVGIRLPIWFVQAALGCLTWMLFRLSRRIAPAKPGFCVVCGYDLRASKERCPECGTPVPGHRPSGNPS